MKFQCLVCGHRVDAESPCTQCGSADWRRIHEEPDADPAIESPTEPTQHAARSKRGR